MKRFIEGEDRSQTALLPPSLDDYVAEDNPVRVVEAFVEQLDLRQLGFEGAAPAATGRPGYHPAVLLKLYVYGYLNRIQSSRRLEREAQRNLEVMWLTGRLDARLQDHRQLPQGQRSRHPRCVPPVHRAVPQAGSFYPGAGGHRWQQVQGRQQPRQELHRRQAQAAYGTDRREHRRLSGGARPR